MDKVSVQKISCGKIFNTHPQHYHNSTEIQIRKFRNHFFEKLYIYIKRQYYDI